MKGLHTNTLITIKKIVESSKKYDIIQAPENRYFEVKLNKKLDKSGIVCKGYMPDFVVKNKKNGNKIIIEIETQAGTAKIIEDAVLATLAKEEDNKIQKLIVVTWNPYYVEKWQKLLKKTFGLLTIKNIDLYKNNWQKEFKKSINLNNK